MKNALLVVIAFALGAGAVWYLTSHRGDGGAAQRGAPVAAGAPGGRPAGGFGGRGAAQPPLVVAEPVRRDQVSDVVEALGTTQANESVTLTAKLTDTVRRVNFEDGDYVEKGAVLIELTNQEEEAALAEARANLNDAQSQLRRLEELAARGLSAEQQLDIARSRADAVQAQLNRVVARLRDRVVQAPFSGLLGFRNVSPGTLVTPTTPITSIDDISVIKLDFTVPETVLGDMSLGAKVVAKSVSFPGREFEGVVRTVGSRVDPITRAITVRAHIPNNDRALRPGMLLTVDVVTSQHEALVVPEGAVFQVQNRAYVYRLDGLTARQQQIEIGARRYGVVEVKSGLEEGDTVVTEGIVKLRDGVQVRLDESANAVSQRRKEPQVPPRSDVRG
ncbi:MAG TPA: efflux RND transporter periplasmic adaptor subunit [Gammaproteobacteria bacterium]|jgi:membrane fusion protein (multidrug efflux system)|nr:efflux RND transporter periplasmic adaptor subunit [Gammaproteobacteria bacterium]